MNKTKYAKHLLIGATFSASAILASTPAFTQVLSASQSGTASQTSEDTYAPPILRAADGGLILPDTTMLDAPEGAEKLHVTPSGLVVVGGLPDMAEAAIEIEVSIKDQRVTGADLYAAAAALETAYARVGYILARVSLPPQTIRDGTPLKLQVTNGFVESVDTSGLPEGVRARVEDVLAPLTGASQVNQREIERRLLLAGDTPGLSLTTTLKPGENPGGTIIIVDGKYRPVTGTVTIDNGTPASLGGVSVSSGLEFNNLLGLGEVFYLRLSGFPSFGSGSFFSSDPRNRQFAAGLNVPLNADGLWANFELLDSHTHPTSSAGFTLLDHYQRFSGSVGYNWLRSRSANLTSSVSFEAAKETQTLDVGGARSAFTEDRLRIFRFTQSGDYFTAAGGYLSGSLTASFGIDGLGARQGTAALPLSRTGAKPNFAKLGLTGNFSQRFANDAYMIALNARAQTTFGQPVVSSEQLGLGGNGVLSGFESGDIQADTGAMIRAELSYTGTGTEFSSNGFTGNASPYIFAAAGIARLHQPTAVEQAVTSAVSFGVGLRVALSNAEFNNTASLLLEYGHGISSKSGLRHKNRFNIRLEDRF